ncbi:MAG: hypothetical protein FJ014_03340 [Chloroflexi bacterium]|nr:hypothetical protein [Chloroflexota bacterium]
MLKKVILDESGRALALTLVILGIGVLLLPVFLSHASTNLSATRAIEEGLKEQYAADAGVEYALYMLANNADVPFTTNTPALANNISVSVTVESEGVYYKITSTAKDTVICSYVKYSPGGNLDLYKGALVSAGDITLAKDCTVDGDIRYGGSFSYGKGFTQLSGHQIKGEVKFPSSGEFVQTYKNEAMAGGTYTGTMTIGMGSITTLGPLYITGNLSVLKNSVITLTGTIYVGGYIDVDMDSDIRGSGSIIANGKILFGKMTGFGTSSDAVIMSVNSYIDFRKDVNIKALIYAPAGSIDFRKESDETGATVMGGVIGKDINAEKLNLFAYDASFYDSFALPGYKDPGFMVMTYNINP